MSPLESSLNDVNGAPQGSPQAAFETRHIGLNQHDIMTMLASLDVASLETLLDEVIPAGIRRHDEMNLPEALSEADILAEMRMLAGQNKVVTSLIGMGY